MTERDDMTRKLLGRVLGPGEPELTCEECFRHLDEYVELELAARGADAAYPGMRPHLRGCAACNEEHDSLIALAGGEG